MTRSSRLQREEAPGTACAVRRPLSGDDRCHFNVCTTPDAVLNVTTSPGLTEMSL